MARFAASAAVIPRLHWRRGTFARLLPYLSVTNQGLISLVNEFSRTIRRVTMRASLSTRNLLTVAAMAASLYTAAQAQQKQDFSKSVSAFPNVIGPYEPRHVQPPSFANSDRTNQILKDGKLMLSLNDAVAMGLENNLDLVIARYNLPIADTDILRTKSGQATRGVSTGLVQGTPGGGVGSIGSTGSQGGGAGGTSTAAGGAGTGAGGIVTSTLGVGPSVDNFDPILTSGLGVEHSNTPQSNIVFTGVSAL